MCVFHSTFCPEWPLGFYQRRIKVRFILSCIQKLRDKIFAIELAVLVGVEHKVTSSVQSFCPKLCVCLRLQRPHKECKLLGFKCVMKAVVYFPILCVTNGFPAR